MFFVNLINKLNMKNNLRQGDYILGSGETVEDANIGYTFSLEKSQETGGDFSLVKNTTQP